MQCKCNQIELPLSIPFTNVLSSNPSYCSSQHPLPEMLSNDCSPWNMYIQTPAIPIRAGESEMNACDEMAKSFRTEIQKELLMDVGGDGDGDDDCKQRLISKDELIEQCRDTQCKQRVLASKDIDECPCIRRVSVILKLYKTYKEFFCESLRYKSIGNYLEYEDLYGYQQFFNDFVHIHKTHMCFDHDSQTFICRALSQRYRCDAEGCNAKHRHSRQRKFSDDIKELVFRRSVGMKHADDADADADWYDNDTSLLYAQKADDVHAYFLQFRA